MTGVSVTPYMMEAGDESIVADRLHAVLSKPPRQPATPSPAAPVADLAGQWSVQHPVRRGQRPTHALHADAARATTSAASIRASS